MSKVVSLGSINVDRVHYLPRETIRVLEDRHDWFPASGETVRVRTVPDGVVETEARNFVGGKGSNQAVAAVSAGADVTLLGSVGADAREYEVVSTLAGRGVTVDSVATTDRETGKAYIFVDESGESWIAIVGGANETTDVTYVDRHFETIRQSDVLLIQNEIPVRTMESLLARLNGRSERPTVIFNPSPADGSAPLIDDAVDVVVVNESEYAALADEFDSFEGTIVRTQGGDDVLVEGATRYRITPPTVDPVDTTGAGDVFCGFLAARLADGRTIERAVDTATIAAARSTEIEGAQAAMSGLDVLPDGIKRSKA